LLVREGPGRDEKTLTAVEPYADEIIVYRNVAEGSPRVFRYRGLNSAFQAIAINSQVHTHHAGDRGSSDECVRQTREEARKDERQTSLF